MNKKIVCVLSFLAASLLNTTVFAASNDKMVFNIHYFNDSNITLHFPYIGWEDKTMQPHTQVEVKASISTDPYTSTYPLITNFVSEDFKVNMACFQFYVANHDPFIAGLWTQGACPVAVKIEKKSESDYNVFISPK